MNNRRLTVKNLMISVVGACLLMAALRQSWGVWATGILPISALVVAFICRYRWREMRSVPGVAVISIPALALLCMAFLGGPGWEVSIAFAVSYEMIALAAWTAWTKRGGLAAFGLGFAAIGVGLLPAYLLLFLNCQDLRSSLFTVQILDEIYPFLADQFPPDEWEKVWIMYPALRSFYIVGHCVLILGVATVGGLFTRWLAVGRTDRRGPLGAGSKENA